MAAEGSIRRGRSAGAAPPPPSRRGKREGQDSPTAAALLDAAAALIRERDTLDISFVEIGRRAELPAGLIGYYFGNKEGLFYALLHRDVGRAVEEVEALAAADQPPVEKMRFHLRSVVHAFYHVPYFNRLLQTVTRDAASDRVTAITQRLLEPLVRAQARIIADGVAAGVFRPVDPMLFFLSMTGAAGSLYSSRYVVGTVYGIATIDDTLHRANVEHIADTYLAGLLLDRSQQ